MLSREIIEKYKPTIGIECHVQFNTKSKLFSGADNDARDAEPNTTVSPLCFGLPGTLPVLNKEAVHLAIKAGIALNAEIASISSFDRKHYFYPDLPKGYQITQLERPIVGKGYIDIPFEEGDFRVGITRAHLEEDAGKLMHPEGADYSLVDLNRAGTPLLEIVSEPDIHSSKQAKAFAQELYLLMKYAGVSDANMYYGNIRFDVNVSVAKKDSSEFGTRTETKNLNSFRSIERAVEYEISRQIELLERGQAIKQETRGWHDAKQKTFSQRSKEEAQDYRYFPDADLPPIEIDQQHIDSVREEVFSLLPSTLREKLKLVGVKKNDIETLILADASVGIGYVSTILKIDDMFSADAALFAANFLVNRDIKERKDAQNGEESNTLPSAQQFADVFSMTKNKELSSNNADILLHELSYNPEVSAREQAEKKQLVQENNQDALQGVIDEVLSDQSSQKAIEDVKAGQDKAIGYLVGQVMKKSKGKANPGLVNELLRKKLN